MAHMGWFQKGGWRAPQGVRTDTVERIVQAGWAERHAVEMGRTSADVTLTDAGREVLA
jgi:DNA-binding MarR family transcriptional regulator